MITFTDLSKQMYWDQGGICCYCGMKLEYPYGTPYRVEHIKPKRTYPHWLENIRIYYFHAEPQKKK